MKEIVKHIRFLLTAEGRVPLPGLGELRAHYVPASAHPARHTFTPPSQRLDFTATPAEPDVLAAHIASLSGKELAVARTEVERFCASVRAALVAGESYMLPGIGTLFTNRDGNISFDADAAYFAQGEGLGFVPFTMEPVPQETVKPEPVIVTVPEQPQEKVQANRLWIVWVVLFVTALAAAGWYFAIQYDPASRFIATFLPEYTAQQPVVDEQPVLPITDTAKTDVIADTVAFDSTTSVFDDTLEPESLPLQPEAPGLNAKYHIIAGAFRSAAGVKQTIEKLQARGYSALVIDTTSTGLMVVSYGGFATEDDADDMLKKIRAEGDREAWIKKANKY
jgi:cell division septation protein DedD